VPFWFGLCGKAYLMGFGATDGKLYCFKFSLIQFADFTAPLSFPYQISGIIYLLS